MPIIKFLKHVVPPIVRHVALPIGRESRQRRYSSAVSDAQARLGQDQLQSHKLVFLGGLHRSGTSLLYRCLSEHPSISGFVNTGVYEDEGQHLQSVYPGDPVIGGPGRFAFHSRSRLTETSPLVSSESPSRLFLEWSQHWDLSKPVLAEKSPPNLTKTRFLQALFPDAYFVIVVRHPVAVSYATQRKWFYFFPHERVGRILYKLGMRQTIESLLTHWVVAHDLFRQDSLQLRNLFVLKYEHFVEEPQRCLNEIFSFIGLSEHPTKQSIRTGINEMYYNMWTKALTGRRSASLGRFARDHEASINQFGYSLLDLERAEHLRF